MKNVENVFQENIYLIESESVIVYEKNDFINEKMFVLIESVFILVESVCFRQIYFTRK